MTLRLILLAALAFTALAGTAQARPHLRDCPSTGSDFTFHVQVRGISCRTAHHVIDGVTFNENTFEFEGPNPWWNCRSRDGTRVDGIRLRCTLGSSDVRWTSRLF